jgi:tRNA modification GTPase
MNTIASIATALGEAAISVIRISGEDSWAMVAAISQIQDDEFKAGTFKLAWIYEGEHKIDQVLLLFFKAPQSFTGEDVVEIHSHGGIWITERILELVLNQGARLAKPGEFTERAFLNHKMDLSQAEAILDLIQARTELAGTNAVRLYQGFLGTKIHSIRSRLLDLLGALTAGIDFPDEVGDYDKNNFDNIVKEILAEIDVLLAGEKEGHILRYGYKVALIGNPNVGKSSLLNALLKKDRAIVTDMAGTTRDVIEESYSIQGVPIVLLDTAGIRDTEDAVEQIGVAKAKEVIDEADLVLLLQDLSTETSSLAFEKILSHKNHTIVGTKLDLVNSSSMTLRKISNESLKVDIKISTLKNTNIEELKSLIVSKVIHSSAESLKINHRQADLLRKSRNALNKALQASREGLAQDFWTIDLKAAVSALGEITGDVITEELLDNIFSRFCIGK